MQNLQEKSKTPSSKPGTRVRVLWSKAPYNLVHDWTQTCVWAIEQFGLPGGKYYTHSTEDSMDVVKFLTLGWYMYTHLLKNENTNEVD